MVNAEFFDALEQLEKEKVSADFDSVLDAPCICKICGNGEVNRIKIQGTAKRI